MIVLQEIGLRALSIKKDSFVVRIWKWVTQCTFEEIYNSSPEEAFNVKRKKASRATNTMKAVGSRAHI